MIWAKIRFRPFKIFYFDFWSPLVFLKSPARVPDPTNVRPNKKFRKSFLEPFHKKF